MPHCKNNKYKKYTGEENTPLGRGYSASGDEPGKIRFGKDGNKYRAGKDRWILIKENKINPRGNVLSRPMEDIFIPVVDELRTISQRIIELYPAPGDTLFLFVGASPAYLYYYFKNCVPAYESVLFPISGLNMISRKHLDDVQDVFNKYSCYFFDKYDYRNIVIIDHSHSGKSIANLFQLIFHKDNYGYDPRKRIPFLEFVDLFDYKTGPIEAIDGYVQNFPRWLSQQTHIIQGNYINDFSGHVFPRLTPQIYLHELQGIYENPSGDSLEDFLREKESETEHGLAVLGEMEKHFC